MFVLVTALLLVADTTVGNAIAIAIEIWANVLTTFPFVLLAGWLYFLAVIRDFRNPGRLVLVVATVALVSELIDSRKDTWFMDQFMSGSRPPYLRMAMRTVTLHMRCSVC